MTRKFYAVKVGKTPGVYMTWDECRANVHGYPGAVYKSFPDMEEARNFAGLSDAEDAEGDSFGTEGSKSGSSAAKVPAKVPVKGSSAAKVPAKVPVKGSSAVKVPAKVPVKGNSAAKVPAKVPVKGNSAAEASIIESAAAKARLKGDSDKKDRHAFAADPGKNNGSCYAFVDGSYNIATKVYGYGGFLVNGTDRYTLQGSGEDPELASMRNVAGEVAGSMAAIAKAVELEIPEIRIYYDYLGIEMWATGAWKRNKKGTAAYYDYVQSVKDRIRITFCKVKGHSGVEGNEEADRLAKEAVGNL